jgi:hypothetical protein
MSLRALRWQLRLRNGQINPKVLRNDVSCPITWLIFALSRRPCSAQIPFSLISRHPLLFHISFGPRMMNQHDIWYSTCGLFSQWNDSNRAAIFFLYIIQQTRALHRNVFLPSWLAIIQSIESLIFRQRESNYRVVAYSRTCRSVGICMPRA